MNEPVDRLGEEHRSSWWKNKNGRIWRWDDCGYWVSDAGSIPDIGFEDWNVEGEESQEWNAPFTETEQRPLGNRWASSRGCPTWQVCPHIVYTSHNAPEYIQVECPECGMIGIPNYG